MPLKFNPFTDKLDFTGNDSGMPSITTLTGNSGGAVGPDGAGNIDVIGTTPITFTGNPGTNTLTGSIAVSQAVASTDITKIGAAAFNSTQFAVDANGFVTLAGGGLAIDSVAMQTGTSPVTPDSNGLWNFSGGTVVAGTNPVRTNGTGANTSTLQVQISQALAAADATKIGLSNFDSNSFAVDADGFVTLNGGSGFTWSNQSAPFNAVKGNGYFITGTCTGTLPASPGIGDTIKFIVQGAFVLTLQANTGQKIQISSNLSSAAGTQVSTANGDACTLVYNSTGLQWDAEAFVGAWNFT